MKNKYSVILAICFLSSLVFLMANQSQNPQWKGKVEIENGIRVIKNPREPLYGEITFELEEDLTIGNEEDENYMFYRGVNIEVDSEGNIFVLDRGNYRIQKYDEEGKYLQTIGRKGQGPGEFNMPSMLWLDHDDNIYVRDGIQIDVFDKIGGFKKSITFPDLLFSYCVTKDGNFIAQVNSRIDRIRGKEEIILFDSEGEKMKIIASFPYENVIQVRGKFYIGDWYGPGLIFRPISEDMGVYGYSSEYKIFFFNSSGEIIQIIEKDQPPEPFTKKEKNKIIDEWAEREKRKKEGAKYSRNDVKETIRFPRHKSYFSSILIDDRNRIFVLKYKLSINNDKSLYYDVFSQEGHYLHKLKVSTPPSVIKNGYIYDSERDKDTSYQIIKRYKIKNWEQIKTGIN